MLFQYNCHKKFCDIKPITFNFLQKLLENLDGC